MFSVLMPVYRHERYVRQAVESALRSRRVAEILIADDGSPDRSPQIVHELAAAHPERVRDLTGESGENKGAPARLNELARAARSEWIAILNSDDLFVKGRFGRIASATARTQADFVFGHLLFMNERSRLVGAKRGALDAGVALPEGWDVAAMIAAGEWLPLLAHQNFLGTTSNMVFRKELFERIGGFRDYRYVHDWDFAIRAAALGRPIEVPRYLTAYRIHGANTIAESEQAVAAESREMLRRVWADLAVVRDSPRARSAIESRFPGLLP